MSHDPVATLLRCFSSLRELCASLGDDAWGVQSLCPDWTVHGVLAHLTGIETALLGWRPDGDSPAPFATIGPFMQDAKAMPGAELAGRFGDVTRAREAELRALGADDLAERSWTPVGVQTYGRFMAIRVFDCWVHEQDMRVPLDRPGHLEGAAAEMSLDEVRGSFGYIAGKRVGVPDGKSVAVHVTGPVEADLCAVVDGRARVVDTVARPDAEITTDFLTFMLLACGRIDPGAALADGRVRPAGDPELSNRLARNLSFTF